MNETIENAARECVLNEFPAYKDENTPFGKEKIERFSRLFKSGYEYALSHQWISVDDDLPKEDNDNEECSIVVLARGNKTYFVAYYDFHDNVWYSEEGCYRLYNITHWMQIPTLEGGEE